MTEPRHPDQMRCTQRIDRNEARLDLLVDLERLINEGAGIEAVAAFIKAERATTHQRWTEAVLERQEAWKAYNTVH